MKRNRKFVRPANANVHTFHPEVVKVLFVLLYGEHAGLFRSELPAALDRVVQTVQQYDGRIGSPNELLPYVAINPALNDGARFAFQRLGLNLKRMHRMNALLNNDRSVIGFDILGMDDFTDMYAAILFDLRDLRVL